MALLSRKSALKQSSWQVLDDLAFCTQRYPRLAELAAQVLVEQQCTLPGVPVTVQPLSSTAVKPLPPPLSWGSRLQPARVGSISSSAWAWLPRWRRNACSVERPSP